MMVISWPVMACPTTFLFLFAMLAYVLYRIVGLFVLSSSARKLKWLLPYHKYVMGFNVAFGVCNSPLHTASYSHEYNYLQGWVCSSVSRLLG